MHFVTGLILGIILGIFLGIFLGILSQRYKRDSAAISPKKAKEMIADNEFDYVIDVRTLEEWNQGHLQSAIHIPINELVNELPNTVPNKLATILFYCKRGIRASGAVEIAKKLGYKNAYYLQGGYSDFQ
jgi:rhodanese-related sulfurtransferase